MYDDERAMAKPSSAIDEGLSRLESQAEVLATEIDYLFSKIAPVVPSYPESGEVAKVESDKPAGQSSVAERVFTVEMQLKRLAQRVSTQTRYCEL